MVTISFTELPLAAQIIIGGVILFFAALALLPFLLASHSEAERSHPTVPASLSLPTPPVLEPPSLNGNRTPTRRLRGGAGRAAA